MKKEEVNRQIKEVVRPNGKGEINGNNLQETLLLMNNNAANDEDTTSKLNLKADKTSVYTKEEANTLLDLKVDIKDYEEDKEVSNKEKQELDIKLTQTKQELDSVKNSLSHMGNGVVGEAKGGGIINLPNNAMKSVVPNYRFEGLTVQNLVQNGDFRKKYTHWIFSGVDFDLTNEGFLKIKAKEPLGWVSQVISGVSDGDYIYYMVDIKVSSDKIYIYASFNKNLTSLIPITGELNTKSGIMKADNLNNGSSFGVRDFNNSNFNEVLIKSIQTYNLTQIFGAGNEPSKEWCDKYLPDYVEGTKSVQLPMRVKSVGGNLFNKNSKVESGWNANNPSKSVIFWNGKINVDSVSEMYASYSIMDKNPALYYRAHKDGGSVISTNKISSEGGVISKFKIPNNAKYINVGVYTYGEEVRREYVSDIIISHSKLNYSPYQESLAYLNNEVELNSVGSTKDYIENGKLYKNISDDGEILEKTEVVNLSTSGLITANPNGTVFFEPITNLTGFYDNGLDVEGLEILEVEEFSHLVNGVYQSLDVSKVKVEGGKLTHPDAQNGIVYLVYRYDDNAVWGENTISYYNSDKTLKSPNGKIWKKVEAATDTGELVVTLEEVNEEIVEP